MGLDLHVISISPADRPAVNMTPVEGEEERTTYVVKTERFLVIARHILVTFLSRPLHLFRGIGVAYRLKKSLRAPLRKAFFYFIEAVIVGCWMKGRGLQHFHSHFSSNIGLIVCSIFPLTMSMTIHGPVEFEDPVGFKIREKVKTASFIIAISNFGRSQLMKVADYVDWEKIEVAPLGVDSKEFLPKIFRSEGDVFEIVSVGRLAPVKAQRILIDAISIVRDQHQVVRLRLIGDGPDRTGLEQYVLKLGLEEIVTFEGACNQDEVIRYYDQADIFALSSFAEGIPVVLMEAMAKEIPVIATRVNGIPELVRDGVDGILVDPSDAGQIANAILQLMEDAPLRNRLGEAGRQRVIENYELSSNTEVLAKILSSRLAMSQVLVADGEDLLTA